MRIDKDGRYYDINGNEIHEGDVVMMDGRERIVYRTTDGELGTDATNPSWIARGLTVECGFGIYPFNEEDKPELVKTVEKG